jgi:TonB family protein
MRVLTLSTLLFVAAVASADDPVSQAWQKMTRESVELLKRGDYNGSLKISQRVIRAMVDRLGAGTAETQSFGIALTHKALALAGLGRKEEALWEWHVALNLYPGLAKTDLSPFGEPGRFLSSNAELRKRDNIRRIVPGESPADVTAPVIRKRVEPQYPGGAYSFGVSGVTVVELLIERNGKVSSPLVMKSLPAPTITYSILNALRQWKFEPGRINGQPADVIFNVSFDFKLH